MSSIRLIRAGADTRAAGGRILSRSKQGLWSVVLPARPRYELGAAIAIMHMLLLLLLHHGMRGSSPHRQNGCRHNSIDRSTHASVCGRITPAPDRLIDPPIDPSHHHSSLPSSLTHIYIHIQAQPASHGGIAPQCRGVGNVQGERDAAGGGPKGREAERGA
jgi:hypothetical protein